MCLSTDVLVPDFYSINYGEVLSEGDNAIWWASSGWKISVNRKLPAVKGKALFISAALNEAEAAQLVITPKKALKGVKVIVSDLKSGVFGSTQKAHPVWGVLFLCSACQSGKNGYITTKGNQS